VVKRQEYQLKEGQKREREMQRKEHRKPMKKHRIVIFNALLTVL